MDQHTYVTGPISRRAAIAGGLTAIAGIATAGTANAAKTAAPTAGGPDRAGKAVEPKAGDEAFTSVITSTMWVEPKIHRPTVDAPCVATPSVPDQWNANMATTESRDWLIGNLESQSLLGARVIVDEVRDGWAKIVVPQQPTPRDKRGYPGWVPAGHVVRNDEFASLVESSPIATITALKATVATTPSGKHPITNASFNTELPVLGETGKALKVALPTGEVGFVPSADARVLNQGESLPPATIEQVIETGERFLGLRYLWAGMSAYGFDCSGFTYSIFRHHGVHIARDAGDQLNHSDLPFVERDDLKRGDLVFFATEPGGSSIRHVGVYVGDGKIMHAPNSSRSVEVIALEAADPNDEYAGAVRVIA